MCWHSFVMTPDGTRGFGRSPLSDEVIVTELTVALVNAHDLKLRSIVNLEPPAPFNPMTCGPVGAPTGPGGCAVHGVTPRPRQ